MENKPTKCFVNWSGGKDCALALFYALQDHQYSVERLVTNLVEDDKRISMHGVSEAMLDAQAEAIGLPLQKVWLPSQPSMQVYEEQAKNTIEILIKDGFTGSIFGDLFLEDLKAYREGQLLNTGLEAIFPLWKKDTTDLIYQFIDLGFKAVVVCVNSKFLDQSFAGRIIDKSFIRDLPPNVDACGENGEFHTFVFDGPIFTQAVPYRLGELNCTEYRSPVDSINTNSEMNQYAVTKFWLRDIL